MGSHYDEVRIIALQLLKRIAEPTHEDVLQKVRRAMESAELTDKDVDIPLLCREIETDLSVWVRGSSVLDSREPHREWLTDTLSFISESRPKVSWAFWRRYARYLAEVKRRPDAVIRALDRTTTDAVKRLEDPSRPGAWDRRGMVVGSVQSGKTAHFTGVICKAADAGYKLIVILAGTYNNLRSQTQLRLDEEFLGQESDKSLTFSEKNQIGVATLFAEKQPIAHWLTNSSDKGDFSITVARQAGITPGGDPILFVVKKNVTILKNLNSWMRTVPQWREAKVRSLPLLVIDDECDQASINTMPLPGDDKEYDLTAINREIRRLLNGFEQVAYIGYTATPFASIFIDPDRPHSEYGEDLFPRSFILNLAAPSTYVGPGEIFGLEADATSGAEARAGQPIVRMAEDYRALIPDRHDRHLAVGDLPDSMKNAMRAFVLGCAVRRLRGQDSEHNSMLIHVSRFVDVQVQIRDLVASELEKLQRRIRLKDGRPGSGEHPIMAELRHLWETDLLPTTRQMVPEEKIPSWDEVWAHIPPAVDKITIKTINGSAGDILDYRNHPDGLSVIAIGGDKLSRGLTLEGLLASYYLRASNMYDTLMQMGRWFGYRPGYADLCRIVTSQELIHLYRWIAMATEELRRDFVHMTNIGASPDDFGLRVKMHPGGMLITSLNKLRTGTRLPLSYADQMEQTLVFDLDRAIVSRNYRSVTNLVAGLDKPSGERRKGGGEAHVWSNVAPEKVMEFLAGYVAHRDNPAEVNTELLREYIKARVDDGELTRWTIALVGGSDPVVRIGKYEVKCSRREPPKKPLPGEAKVTLNGLTSPIHEAIDLGEEQYGVALQTSIREWEEEQSKGEGRRRRGKEPRIPYPSHIRAQRLKEKGLLLLYVVDAEKSSWGEGFSTPAVGFGISFPPSEGAADHPIHYMVNKRYVDEWQ
jgi:hypothetical protein